MGLASMGPRPDGRGTCYSPAGTGTRPLASMGPRPDGRGTSAAHPTDLRLGTLQWGRDRMAAERRPARPSQTSPASFNGAATGWPRNVVIAAVAILVVVRLQWGRDRMAAERLICSLHVSLRPSLQWGRDRMAAERSPRAVPQFGAGRFNGAATGWPRNARGPSAGAPPRICFNGAATGWPRNATSTPGATTCMTRFNGAATGWPRNVLHRHPRRAVGRGLQWGRDRMAAERMPRPSQRPR